MIGSEMENPSPKIRARAFSRLRPPLEETQVEQVEQENEQETKPVEGITHAHGTPAPEKDARPRPTEGEGVTHAHGTPEK